MSRPINGRSFTYRDVEQAVDRMRAAGIPVVVESVGSGWWSLYLVDPADDRNYIRTLVDSRRVKDLCGYMDAFIDGYTQARLTEIQRDKDRDSRSGSGRRRAAVEPVAG